MDADARIELTGVRVRAATCDAAAVVRELASPAWSARAKVIKAGSRGMVAAGVLDAVGGQGVVVKTHRLVGPRDRIAAAMGRSRLARQARGALLLERAGIATARAILVATGSDARSGSVEVLVLEFVSGVSVAHHAARADLAPAARRMVAYALGAQVARIAEAGLVNRDHKASNIVVRTEGTSGTGGLAPVVVDTVGIRRSHPAAARVRMLFGLVVELVGLGIVPGRTDRMRVVCAAIGRGPATRKNRKRVWRAVDALVRMHGDATPRDNPLAHPSDPTGV